MKKLCILLAAMILLFAGCQNATPTPTDPPETLPVTEPVTEPATVPETTPTTEPVTAETEPEYLYYDIFPPFDDPDWELTNPEYGLYRYTGDMDKIELDGYSLSIPEKWQDKVSVLRSDPAGSDDLVYVVGNALAEAHVEIAQRLPDGSINDVSFWDCIVQITRVAKTDMEKSGAVDEVESGHAALAGEDGDKAYLVRVHDLRNDGVLFVREELVNQIGQEAYDELLDGLDCTLEEAAAMISIGE